MVYELILILNLGLKVSYYSQENFIMFAAWRFAAQGADIPWNVFYGVEGKIKVGVQFLFPSR
jgi:hypothetical protein